MLQFHSNRLFGLAFDYHGMAIPEENGLKLVFRKADGPVDVLAQDCQIKTIRWDDIVDLQIHKGLVGAKVVIAVGNRDELEKLPFHADGAVTLLVYPSNFDELAPFQQRVSRLRHGARSDDVDQVIDDVRDLLEGDWDEFEQSAE